MGLHAQPTSTPSSTTDFTSPVADGEGTTSAGIESTGSWDSTPAIEEGLSISVLEQIPAPIRPSLPVATNPSVLQVSPNSYRVTLRLNGTVQLAPSFVNALSQSVAAQSPNVFAFVYQTRQRLVATVSDAGLVTAVGRGSCSILVGSARTANMPFTNAAPAAGLTGCESFCELTVIVVE